MFVHMVFFWLKNDSAENAKAEMLRDCDELLRKIPAVRHLWFGRPAMTPRDVVDNTYDVGLCVAYDDAAGHDAYQIHPLHQEFGKRHKAKWARIQVYDFL